MLPIINLMGPTACGKTRLAIALTQHLPCEIISVDSAMVYRGMDIGTAKPTPEEQALAPHQLLDILDPSQPYSAGQFCVDAKQAITQILEKGRIPLLVGGTMLYFRALQQGLSPLPSANPTLRAQLSDEADKVGWEAMYQKLRRIDPIAAQHIKPHDKQRIQRALEVYVLTGRPISDFHHKRLLQPLRYPVINIALIPNDRAQLHERISQRFAHMLKQGFVEEVRALQKREDLYQFSHPCDLDPGLHARTMPPSLRAVGYQQIWHYLAGLMDADAMQAQAIAATRQLAKRQLTWLKSWQELITFESEQPDLLQKVLEKLFSHYEFL